MDSLYLLFWTPSHSDLQALRPGTADTPNGYLTEPQALAAAFRAISCGFFVERIDRPDGSIILSDEITRRYSQTRG